MSLLILSIVPLLLGPLLYEWARKRTYFLSVLDGFIFISISALLFLHFLEGLSPENILTAIGFLLFGFLGPNYLEKRLEKGASTVHMFSMAIGVVGLIAHAALDGAGLVVSHEAHAHHLPIAIILHRIPVGLMLWWLLAPVIKRSSLIAIFLFMIVATVAGWFSGVQIIEGMSPFVRIAIESFVAGSILHVVFFKVHISREHDHTAHSCCSHESEPAAETFAFPDAIGNFLAMLFIAVLIYNEPDLWEVLREPLDVFISLALQSAPALVAAYVLAGLLYAFLPMASYLWLGKGSRPLQALKGVIFGLPLPICSCGVLPFYKSLVDRGVAKTAALAFLVATPELGLDAILISIPLLGYDFTLWRLVAAFIVAYLVAILLGKGAQKKQLGVVSAEEPKSFSTRLRLGWRYGFCDLVDSTGPWILVGLVVAALLQPILHNLPLSFPYHSDVLIFAVVGIFFYVCATGATPLVAIFLSAGLSPGAGLAFLLTGPATNVSTFGVLSSLHSKKFALSFGVLVTVLACLLGLVVNLTVGNSFRLETLLGAHHESSSWQEISLVVVVALLLFAIVRRGARRFLGEIFGGEVHGSLGS